MGGKNLGGGINKPQKAGPLSLKTGGDMGEVTRRLFGGINTPGIRETGTLSPDRLSTFFKAHRERAPVREEKPYQPPKVHPNLSLKTGGDMGEVTRRLFGGINTPGYDSMSTFLKARPERKKVRNRRSLMY